MLCKKMFFWRSNKKNDEKLFLWEKCAKNDDKKFNKNYREKCKMRKF